MYSFSFSLNRLAFAILFILLTSETPSAAVSFNSGGPISVSGIYGEDIYVRNQGCFDFHPCASPGAPTTATFSSGANTFYGFSVRDTSIAIIQSTFGTGNFGAGDNSIVYLEGGVIDPEVHLWGSAQFFMSSGSIEDDMTLRHNGYAEITGGALGRSLFLVDDAQVDIRGGFYNGGLDVGDDMYVDGASVLRFFGSSFEVNGLPVGYGDISSISGTLSGILESGEAFSVDIGTGSSNTGTIVLTPEPSTAFLLALGLIGLARFRPG